MSNGNAEHHRNVIAWLLKLANPSMPWREIGELLGVHGETVRAATLKIERQVDHEMVKLTIPRDLDPPWLRRLRVAGAVGGSEPTGYQLSRRLIHERSGHTP